MPNPTWRDGAPANLEAAAMDALDWLRWFKPELDSRLIRQADVLADCQQRLASTIAALDNYLPDKTMIFED